MVSNDNERNVNEEEFFFFWQLNDRTLSTSTAEFMILDFLSHIASINKLIIGQANLQASFPFPRFGGNQPKLRGYWSRSCNMGKVQCVHVEK